jgi:hypothetical protein
VVRRRQSLGQRLSAELAELNIATIFFLFVQKDNFIKVCLLLKIVGCTAGK